MVRLTCIIISLSLQQFVFRDVCDHYAQHTWWSYSSILSSMARYRSHARLYQALGKVSRCIYFFLLYRRKCCRRRWMVICRRWALACPEVEGQVTEFGIRRRLERFYAWGAPVVARIEYFVSIRSIVYLKDLTKSKQIWHFNLSAHKDTFFSMQMLVQGDTTRYLSTQWERQVSQM